MFCRGDVIDHLPLYAAFLIVHHQAQLSFLSPQYYGLSFHPPHHVKGILRLTPQRHLQDIVRNPLLHRLFQLPLDLKIPIGRTQSADPLVRPFVIVVLQPMADPLSCLLKTPKLRPHEKLFIDRLPETLDLAQRHRMMGLRFDVLDPVLHQLPLKPGRSPPVRILPAPVREHLLRDPVLANRPAIHLQYLVRRLSPAQLQAHHVPRVVIDKPDQIGIAAPQTKREDI